MKVRVFFDCVMEINSWEMISVSFCLRLEKHLKIGPNNVLFIFNYVGDVGSS